MHLNMWTKWTTIFFAIICLNYATGAAVQCELSKRPFTIEHEEYCDKYYVCQNGKATEELCGDGLVFDIEKETCDLPHTVVCGDRLKLQNPNPTSNCPRLHGMFPVQGTCDQFYHCTDGLHTLITCPPGVVFEPTVGACVHADQSTRTNCSASKVLDFVCPNFGSLSRPLKFGDHDRLAHPTSCRHFYMCLLTGMPRLGGCTYGLVFNPASGRCDQAKNVPGCENWYGDDENLEEEEGVEGEERTQAPTRPPKRINNSAIRSLASTTVATSAPTTTTAATTTTDIPEPSTAPSPIRNNISPQLARRLPTTNNLRLTRTQLELNDPLGANIDQ